MQNPFSFQGQIRPLPYALWSLTLFFSQHAIARLLFTLHGFPPALDWSFLAFPLRSAVTYNQSPPTYFVVLALACLLIVDWALAALSVRRAVNANISQWVAAAAITPLLQLAVIPFLCVMPPRNVSESEPAIARTGDPGWVAAAQGVIAGMLLTLYSVAVGTLIFGSYGFVLFLVAPFVIGAVTAFLANRKADLGKSRTTELVLFTVGLGSFALVLSALEGAACIVMAAPLGLLLAWIGGKMGRSIAIASDGSSGQAMSGFVVLPIAFAVESAFPATTHFETQQTIAVRAPPELVWKAIVQMDTIEPPRALPFRLGIAYPIRGEVIGEGVGALRRGEFSTGTAIERVTEWTPNRKLAFVVEKDIPGLRELSPYEHVHAPHVIGYFRTTHTSFELTGRPDGHTEIVERTSHQLRLDPALYWLPLARWVVDQNNARVLAHIQRQAEQSVKTGAAATP
jgi:uncharacterized membrane protein YhaH (DUF805 family)